MRRNRFIATIVAGLLVIALVPVATAFGDDDDAPQANTIEAVTALGTAFTYQGRLVDAGSPANGAYDLRFILYDADSAGAAVGSTQTKEDVAVTTASSPRSSISGFGLERRARWVEIRSAQASTGRSRSLAAPAISPTRTRSTRGSGRHSVPFAATGSSPVCPRIPGLFTVTQTGTGIAISGNRTSTDARSSPASSARTRAAGRASG